MHSTIFPPQRVTIVGIVNATPDSFSDGGRFVEWSSGRERPRVEQAVEAAAVMLLDGAHILDVGGESTRPGALEVPADVETGRVVPVIEALAKRFDVPISIDTRKAAVADEALVAGATIVNDVSGLRFDPALARSAARADAGLIVGHLRGVPETMQDEPHFDDVLTEVTDELEASVQLARESGIPDEHIAVDPGIGFGKRSFDNLALLARCGGIGKRLGLPVLVGPSRKGFLGTLTGDAVNDRDLATVAACAVACFQGADAIRVHDAAGARRAAVLGRALASAREEGRA